MSNVDLEERPVTGRVDGQGRLLAADPPLAALHRRAGGSDGGLLSVPQIAALARLAHRLGITVSRAAIAADGDHDVDLWVRAAPDGNEVADVFEVPLAVFLDEARALVREVEYRGRLRTIHEFDVEGRRIWGATAAMLINLRSRLRLFA